MEQPMAEGEAAVRATSDGGQGTGGHMMGGSLPPRKRLLAGLKQNGSWLASSSPPPSTTSVHRPGGGGRPLGSGAVAASRSSPSEGGAEKSKGGCMSCGVLESDLWRKGKRNGGLERGCDSCNAPDNKNSNCPKCQGVLADVKDSGGCLECSRCQRLVHVGCEQKGPPALGDGGSYVCPDCSDFKKDEGDGNTVLKTRNPTGRPCSTSGVEDGNCALPSAAECSSPCHKKPRVSREPRSRSNDGEADETGSFEDVANRTKGLGGRKGSSSKEAAAAAAAATAAAACRAAAAAKAFAAAKAVTAVRAAALAKAALDAAALAAQVEAQVRTELRRSSCLERTSGGDVKPDAAASCQLRKGRGDESDVKPSGGVENSTVTNTPSIDDEELARRLHRAINSSPRISSGLTPLRRKPSTKPLPTVSTPHAVTSWPRLGMSGDSEPPSSQVKQQQQQQAKPRSLQPNKEVKPFDPPEVKLESKPLVGSIRTKVSQRHSTDSSGNVTDPPPPFKSERAEVSTGAVVSQDSGKVPLRDETSAPLNVASEAENNRINGHQAVPCAPEDSQDRTLSTSDVSQAAALLDEVLRSEADEGEVLEEENLSRVQDRAGTHLKEAVDASSTMTVEGKDSQIERRLSEEDRRESTEDGGGGLATTNMSVAVAALVQVASSEMALLENREPSSNEAVSSALPVGGDNDNLEHSADAG